MISARDLWRTASAGISLALTLCVKCLLIEQLTFDQEVFRRKRGTAVRRASDRKLNSRSLAD
jgi:hypothetical protein